jgi:hypothetical protein
LIAAFRHAEAWLSAASVRFDLCPLSVKVSYRALMRGPGEAKNAKSDYLVLNTSNWEKSIKSGRS